MKHVPPFLLMLGVLLLAAPALVAATNIPASYEASRYESLWKHSPFTLSSISDEQGPSNPITERYSLGGAYTIGSDDYIFVVNRTNPQERFVVSKTPNAQGLSLVSVTYNNATPDKTVAVIKQGDETGTISFDAAQIKAGATASAANPGMPPGNIPGQPPRPLPNYTPQPTPGSPARVIRRPRIIAPPPGTTPSTPATPTRP